MKKLEKLSIQEKTPIIFKIKKNFFLKKYFVLLILFALFGACSESDSNLNENTNNNLELNDNLNNWKNWYGVKTAGLPTITNINMESYFDSEIFAIEQCFDKRMLVLSQQGVLLYDGARWNEISTNHNIICIATCSENKRTFAGDESGFGEFIADGKGFLTYTSLLDTNEAITEIETTAEKTFFLGEKHIFVLHIKENKIENIPLHSVKPTTIFLQNNTLHLITTEGSIFMLNNNQLQETGEKVDNEIIICAFNLNDSVSIIGTSENKIYKFNGKQLSEIKISANAYLKNNYISNGIALNTETYALSTLGGGCIVIDAKSDSTIITLNYQTGLADEEVLYLSTDKSAGLWMVHGRGISCANLALPLKRFNVYPGLSGRPVDVALVNNTLYIATTQGVFYLDTVRNIEEIRRTVVRKPQPSSSDNQQNFNENLNEENNDFTNNNQDDNEEEVSENQNNNNNSLSNRINRLLRRIKKDDEKTTEVTDSVQNNQTTPETNNTTNTENENIEEISEEEILQQEVVVEENQQTSENNYLLQSIPFVFRKIEAIETKCTGFINLNNDLYVSSFTGLYKISNKVATPLLANTNISCMVLSNNKTELLLGSQKSLFSFNLTSGEIAETLLPLNTPVYSILQTGDGSIWATGIGKICKIENDTAIQVNLPKNSNDKIYCFLRNDSILFTSRNNTFLIENNDVKYLHHNEFAQIIQNNNILWGKTENYWTQINQPTTQENFITNSLKFFTRIETICEINGTYWVIADNELFNILKTENSQMFQPFIQVAHITNSNNDTLNNQTVELEHYNNSLIINLFAPFYPKSETTEYLFYIEGLSKPWTMQGANPEISLPFIPAGKHKMHIKATNIFGAQSNEIVLQISVNKPIWREAWFYIVLSSIIFLAVFFVGYFRRKMLKAEKKRLEEIVMERTHEILEQKEEIEVQAQHLQEVNEQLNARKNELEDKNNKITASINYASRIQQALLPPIDEIQKHFAEVLIYFHPRDIVSGDFYWFSDISEQHSKDETIYIAAADCTGHGVPGALMSMLGISFLNKIVNEKSISKTNEILNRLRDNIINSLKQNPKERQARDGMDIAICAYKPQTKKLFFSGAHNSLYHIRNNELNEIKGDKMPAAVFTTMEEFTAHEVDIQQNDIVYLFSDGYHDQLGGDKRTKFMKKNFRELILNIHQLDMKTQYTMLDQKMKEWMQKGENQTDDMLIIGLRF